MLSKTSQFLDIANLTWPWKVPGGKWFCENFFINSVHLIYILGGRKTVGFNFKGLKCPVRLLIVLMNRTEIIPRWW